MEVLYLGCSDPGTFVYQDASLDHTFGIDNNIRNTRIVSCVFKSFHRTIVGTVRF